MYDGLGKNIKLNTSLEMVGILNYIPTSESEEKMDDGERNIDNIIKNEEQLPKLHVLTIFNNTSIYLHKLDIPPSLVNSIINYPEKIIAETQSSLFYTKGKLKGFLIGSLLV